MSGADPGSRPDNNAATESSTTNAETTTTTTTTSSTTKPLAPPPRPGQNGESTPDYFSSQLGGGGLLSLEPNPFEQSFGGGGAPETPGGTKLPPVAALTSPSSLLPGTGVTPFNWGGGSLRTGPLSPAMLSGPTTDYFSDSHHIRGGFPTPNESSLRTGLTPGGSGSMFPAPSPNSAALFASLGSGTGTPTTIDFHRTALSAAAKRSEQNSQAAHSQSAVTSSAQELADAASVTKVEPKPASGPFDPHDNDAANGLFLLAQGSRNSSTSAAATTTAPAVEPPPPPAATHPAATIKGRPAFSASPEATVATVATVNGSSAVNGAASDAGSGISEEADHNQPSSRPNTRARGKRNSTAAGLANGRGAAAGSSKTAEDRRSPPKKKAKGAAQAPPANNEEEDESESEEEAPREKNTESSTNNKKMTDEEKRKNFLERNRYEFSSRKMNVDGLMWNQC